MDPDGLANQWIRNMEKTNQLKVIETKQPNFFRFVETAVASGRPLLIEITHRGALTDLETLLLIYNFNSKRNPGDHVNFGGKDVQYNAAFRMYITCPFFGYQISQELRDVINYVDFTPAK